MYIANVVFFSEQNGSVVTSEDPAVQLQKRAEGEKEEELT